MCLKSGVSHFIIVHLGFALLFITCSSFNLEERAPLIKQGPSGSLFGLSVAQHHITENPSNLEDVVLLVGAPTADAQLFHSSDSYKPGALFKCNLSTNQHDCQAVMIDNSVNTLEVNNSNQWLGVMVKREKPGGKVVVCAHRFTIRGGGNRRGVIWEAEVGRCYLLQNDLKPVPALHEWTPCIGRTDPDGSYSNEYYGYCQAGTSVAFANNKDEDLVFGMPGPFHWTGAIRSNELAQNLFFPAALWSEDEPATNVISTNSYLGFSVATGRFFGSNINFAVGAPRANDTGAVVIFEKSLKGFEKVLRMKEIVRGERLASSFGYDVKVIDVTGDGRDDLIIGAPQYYDRNNKIGGALYIYINKGTDRIGPDPTKILYGNLDSSFGSSITNLGDINMDGVNDIAIGAPGADKGAGAVYIYHGNSDPDLGVFSTPTQVLKGATLTASGMLSKNMSGFGYSVNGGLDMDFNGYPDLLIGSLSDTAVLYRTCPIVNVQASIKASVVKISINPDQSENTKEVTSGDNKKYKLVTFNISVCMNYTSAMDTFNEAVDMEYTIKLDVLRLDHHLPPRVSFIPLKQQSIKNARMKLYPQQLHRNKCATMPVYLTSDVQDKLSPIKMSLEFDVVRKEISSAMLQGDVLSLDRYPIFNKDVVNITSTKVNISKECGSDEICKSLLEMNAHYVVLPKEVNQWKPLSTGEDGLPLLLVGTEKEIGISVKVTNIFPGEDAHQAKLTIFLPDFLHYVGLANIDAKGAAAWCTTVPENTSLVLCFLGNPFRTDSSLSMVVRLEDGGGLYEVDTFTTKLQISTSSTQPHYDFMAYRASVKVQANLKIVGFTNSDQLPFSGKVIGESAVKKPQDAGLFVDHTYEIENAGNNEVEDVYVNISWPQQIENEKWLFYPLDVEILGHGRTNESKCYKELFNPLNLSQKSESGDLVALDLKRRKRQVSADSSSFSPSGISGTSLNKRLVCSDFDHCLQFGCDLGTLRSKKKIFIKVKGVVWNSTFIEEFSRVPEVLVSSKARIGIKREQKHVLYADTSVLVSETTTIIFSKKVVIPEQVVQPWIIAVATAAGVVLLVVLVLVLWKCGFFKRRRDFGDYQKARGHKQASRKADESSDGMLK